MKTRQKSQIRIIWYILFLALFCLYLFFAIKKQGFFLDELYTYGLSNSTSGGDIVDMDIFDTLQSAEVFKVYLTVQEKESFSYGSVFFNQAKDVHPPLYYLIFHTLSSIFIGSYSKWIGISINLVAIFFSFLLLRNIILEICKDHAQAEYVALCVVFSYGILPMTISNVIYIRMYMLLTLWTILYLYIHILLYKYKKRVYLFFLFLTTVAGVLTQYYFLIFAFFLSLAYICDLFFKRAYKEIVIYASVIFGALLLAFLIFPASYSQLLGGNNTYTTDAFTGNLLTKLCLGLISFISIINYGMFGTRLVWVIILFGIFILYIYRNRNGVEIKKEYLFMHLEREETRLIQVLCIVTGLSIFTIICVSWVIASRYFYTYIPYIVIIIVYSMHHFIRRYCENKKKRTCYYMAFILVMCAMSVYGYTRSLQNTNQSNIEPVDYLYMGEGEVIEKIEKETLPFLILTAYKNATVTENLYELSVADMSYVTAIEHIHTALEKLDMPEKFVVSIDKGNGLWGSGYDIDEVEKILETYGYVAEEKALFERALCRGYVFYRE